MVQQKHPDYELQLYSQLYLSQDMPGRSDITIFDFIFFLIMSSVMLTLFAYVLQKLLDEEIKLIEKRYEADFMKYSGVDNRGCAINKSSFDVKNVQNYHFISK